MRVRIEDVALAAGVSMKTVSRVLNGEPGVRPHIRERVNEVARSMNYRPDPSARRLAGKRSYLVGFVYDNPSANYLMELIGGVVEACEELHYGMLVQPVSFKRPDFVQAIKALVDFSKLDGLILTPPLTDSDALLGALREAGIAFSCVSPKDCDSNIGATLDERQAVHEIVGLLVAHGHRRIGHIQGHPEHGASAWRLDGYRDALAEHGLPFDPALVVPGEFSFDSGVHAARRLLDLPDPPTAIFAANDDMAAGVFSAVQQRGLRIPQDISICGFDDMPVSRQIFPPLTTVHQPARDMGRVVTIELIKSIRAPGSGTMVRMPHSMCLRGSVGPVPAS
ncbi:LacI family transcriptional regulator [[Pseudomonas] boreopolis]|uniref:LacI family transcriptional regulator n=1 Tax=Xanthomonas boreopolis TaxID=86183 RepID=A0A919F8G8_9XANT|nr:LacI family transcriptional regulator [[Pseudomonas] boreopolis]